MHCKIQSVFIDLFRLYIWPELYIGLKSIVNCWNSEDMGSPEFNSVDWYSIRILYMLHTQSRIKSKFPNHSKAIYWSDIYELIFPPMLLAGRWVLKLTLLLLRELETADPHACIDRRAFSANIVHSPNVGLMLSQRRRRWCNINTALGECLVVVVPRVL